MKFFRLHSTRRIAVYTLVLGFTLYLWKPVNAKENHAEFSNWLESFVKNHDTDNLQQKLDHLSKLSGDLEDVADIAADIILEHNEDFDLPFGGDSDESSDLKQKLISSWHQQQQQGGMSAAFLNEGGKTVSILKNDLLPLFGQSQRNFSKQSESDWNIAALNQDCSSFKKLSPLETGLVIGAP